MITQLIAGNEQAFKHLMGRHHLLKAAFVLRDIEQQSQAVDVDQVWKK